MTLPARPRKRKPKGRHPDKALSTAFVRKVAQAGRYCDGQGLYLDVQPTGSRSWIQRIAIRGRRRELGLGGFPLVSLAEARERAFANRKLARDGGDPLADKRRAKGMPTFAEAAERVWTDKQAGWRSSGHVWHWKASLETYAFPRIGRMPVSDVTSADVSSRPSGASSTSFRLWRVTRRPPARCSAFTAERRRPALERTGAPPRPRTRRRPRQPGAEARSLTEIGRGMAVEVTEQDEGRGDLGRVIRPAARSQRDRGRAYTP